MCETRNTKIIKKPDRGNAWEPQTHLKRGQGLDTLRQLGTNDDDDDGKLAPLRAVTKKDDSTVLRKRAQRKYLNNALVFGLVDAAKENESSELGKQYWQTYHCGAVVKVANDGRVTSKYCNKRWCVVCNAIRSAQLIRQYNPILDTWQSPYFVTLTVPAVKANELNETLDAMQVGMRQAKDTLKKRGQRRKGQKFVGIRKLECNYNPRPDTFNPHFHLLVDGFSNSKALVDLWLEKTPTATNAAQDIRRCDDNSRVELFKYFAKVITKTPDGERAIYADALDVIFNAVRGRRTVQNFGFRCGSAAMRAQDASVPAQDVVAVLHWQDEVADWVDPETGELLSGFCPSDSLRDIVEKGAVVRTGHFSG